MASLPRFAGEGQLLSGAKLMGARLRQNEAWRVEGIGDFLAGKYRPGLPSSNKEPDKG
jgi:hypothetical protein